MKTFCILLSSVVLLAAAAPDTSGVDHYKVGQKLFGEKSFAAALEQFELVDDEAPNEPQVYSWIAASLNELGRHAEAKQRLEAALELLREEQRQAAEKKQPVPPIDPAYYALLARIQVNLRDFEGAAKTIQSYPVADVGEAATKARAAIEAARQTVKATLVAAGTECLRSGDLACARASFAQAQLIAPESLPVREAVARELLSLADRATGATEEDKAKKTELYQLATAASRIWLEGAGAGSVDAQRVLANALIGAKTEEGYEEAIAILTALWDAPADPAQRDPSIQLDLATAHAGREQWDLAVAAATAFIELDPDDPLGQGYCLRSFGQFQRGRCAEAIEDGPHCKNADGSERSLKFIDICRQRLAKREADKSAAQDAAQEAKLERRCEYLYERIKWARGNPVAISLDDLVQIIADVKTGGAKCGAYFDAAEKKETGNGFSAPTPALCVGGVRTASFPLNMSTRSKENLQALRAKTQEFLTLCRPSLNAAQVAGVEGGLRTIDKALH